MNFGVVTLLLLLFVYSLVATLVGKTLNWRTLALQSSQETHFKTEFSSRKVVLHLLSIKGHTFTQGWSNALVINEKYTKRFHMKISFAFRLSWLIEPHLGVNPKPEIKEQLFRRPQVVLCVMLLYYAGTNEHDCFISFILVSRLKELLIFRIL